MWRHSWRERIKRPRDSKGASPSRGHSETAEVARLARKITPLGNGMVVLTIKNGPDEFAMSRYWSKGDGEDERTGV